MNTLIKGGILLLEKNGVFYTEKGDVYISGDTIESVKDAPADFTADKVINAEGGLVMPGLINCHTHAYMSVFRNLADDVSFDQWLFKTIMPFEDKLTSEMAYWGSMLTFEEMLKSGTTTFLDMHMFEGMSCKAAVKTGIRGVISRGLSGNGNDEGGARRIREAVNEMEEYRSAPNLSFMLGPHAIYSCDTGYLEIIMNKAEELDVPLNIHLSETRYEVQTAMENYGKSPVKYLDDMGFFNRHTVAAHCIHVDDDDISILADKGVYVALNPKSNMKLGNGFAPVGKMLGSGVNLCIGTDSAASNNSLNLFSEMNFTALIHKGTAESAQSVSANDTLLMATKTAAKACGINAGELKAGKLADIAILDLNRPQLQPLNSIVSSLCYSANGSEVETVLVGGKTVLENGRLVGTDENEIHAKAQEAINSIR